MIYLKKIQVSGFLFNFIEKKPLPDIHYYLYMLVFKAVCLPIGVFFMLMPTLNLNNGYNRCMFYEIL